MCLKTNASKSEGDEIEEKWNTITKCISTVAEEHIGTTKIKYNNEELN